VIGQLASLFLTTSGSALGSPLGPNVLTIGDTVHALPEPDDVRCADVLTRMRDERRRLVLVDLARPSSHDALAGLAGLLERFEDVEIVIVGDLASGQLGIDLGRHPRVVVSPALELADLLVVLAAATVLISDDADLVGDAPGLGTAGVLVDGPNVPQPGDSIRSVGGSSVLADVTGILEGDHGRRPAPSDGAEATRAEQAVAWMFGLCQSPHLDDVEEPAETSGVAARRPDTESSEA
jgi:UDP-N-acetylglucosamine 2-epimerase (non-hydrolysing)